MVFKLIMSNAGRSWLRGVLAGQYIAQLPTHGFMTILLTAAWAMLWQTRLSTTIAMLHA